MPRTILYDDPIQGIGKVVEPVDIIDGNNSTAVDKADYDIKMDGEYRQFEGGGIRYTKTGKGRFDLIPSKALSALMETLGTYAEEPNAYCDVEAMVTAVANRSFTHAILLIAYAKYNEQNVGTAYVNYPSINTPIVYDYLWRAVIKMLKDLAIHYEKGAEKYGENNWRKGIPLNSFEDSGFRHFCQWLNDETDEPHHISAIWNFMCWLELELTEADIPNVRSGHICD